MSGPLPCFQQITIEPDSRDEALSMVHLSHSTHRCPRLMSQALLSNSEQNTSGRCKGEVAAAGWGAAGPAPWWGPWRGTRPSSASPLGGTALRAHSIPRTNHYRHPENLVRRRAQECIHHARIFPTRAIHHGEQMQRCMNLHSRAPLLPARTWCPTSEGHAPQGGRWR